MLRASSRAIRRSSSMTQPSVKAAGAPWPPQCMRIEHDLETQVARIAGIHHVHDAALDH
jgi:hypothetical protein